MLPVHTPTLINHPLGTHSDTRLLNKHHSSFVVSKIIDPKLAEIVFTNSLYVAYNLLLSMKNIFICASFFLFLFSFSSHTFCELARTCVNLKSFPVLSVHLFVKYLTCFLMDFRQTCVSISPLYTCGCTNTVYLDSMLLITYQLKMWRFRLYT